MATIEDLGRELKRQYPGAYTDLSDADLGRLAKKKYPDRYKDYGDEGLLQRAGKDISIGFRSGVSDLAHTVSNVGRVAHVPEIVKTGEEYAQKLAPRPEEVAGRNSVVDQVLQGVGSAPATLLKYAPAEVAGPYAPLAAGAIGALSAADKGPLEAAKAGLRDVVMFGAMGKTAKLPSRTARAAGGAAVAGGTAAVFGEGGAKEITSAAIMGGGFGAIGSKKKAERALTPEQAKALLEGGADSISKVRDIVRRAIAPQNRGADAAREAHIIRANTSAISRQSDIADYALRQASKAFRYMKDDERLKVIAAIEKGEKQADPKIQSFVDTMREIHNGVRDELINEGKYVDPQTGEAKYSVLRSVKEAIDSGDDALKSYYVNYFPHLFKNPEKAADLVRAMYSGKRPLAGPATFTHQRTYPTIEEMTRIRNEKGQPLLELVTTDPVEAYLLKWREMKRFTAGLRIAKEMEQNGVLEWVAPGKRGPQGWVEIRDSHVFRKARTTEKGGAETVAVAWAPEQAARVLNNYLTPGLRGHASVGGAVRGLMGFNNVLNQAQLGFSAFHLGFTSVDAVTSRFALGVEQMVEGLRRGKAGMTAKGAKNIAMSTPIGAPFTLAQNLRLGARMRREWLKPGSTDPETARLVSLMQESGGGLSLDPVYRTNMTTRLREAIRQHGSYVGMLLHDPLGVPKTFLSLNERFAGLILNQFVPRQKLGVFADLMRFELERLPEGATQDQIRGVGAKVWDSVDNRMGMLRYDNLFWEKWLKDMAMITFRSVGWNLGTLRELGGGVSDWTRLGKAFLKGTNKEFTHRMAYTVALPMVTGMMGAFIHYLYNGPRNQEELKQGKGIPKDPMDWFFPWTGRYDEFGRKERISIPSYIKDVYHLAMASRDVAIGAGGAKGIGLLAAKVHSTWGVLADMLMNRDFYNTQVVNPEDPMVKKGLDLTSFLIKQYSPFSWTNIARERKMNFPISEQVGTFVGFVPAPADIKKTPAERLATEIMAENLPKRANTREQRDRQDRRRELERRIRTQDRWQEYAQEGIDAGVLSDQDVMYAVDRASGLPLDRSVDRMRLADVPRIWRVASAEEKRRLRPIIAAKLERNVEQIQAMPGNERKTLATKLLEILNEPIPQAPPGR